MISSPARCATRPEPSRRPGPPCWSAGRRMALADVRDTSNHDLRGDLPGGRSCCSCSSWSRCCGPRSRRSTWWRWSAAGFAATLGAVTLVFQTGLGHAGLQFALPIILYLFVTAIGTDYNILMTARLREEIARALAPGGGRARDRARRPEDRRRRGDPGRHVRRAAGLRGAVLRRDRLRRDARHRLVAFVVSILLVPAMTRAARPAAWWPRKIADATGNPGQSRRPSSVPSVMGLGANRLLRNLLASLAVAGGGRDRPRPAGHQRRRSRRRGRCQPGRTRSAQVCPSCRPPAPGSTPPDQARTDSAARRCSCSARSGTRSWSRRSPARWRRRPQRLQAKISANAGYQVVGGQKADPDRRPACPAEQGMYASPGRDGRYAVFLRERGRRRGHGRRQWRRAARGHAGGAGQHRDADASARTASA